MGKVLSARQAVEEFFHNTSIAVHKASKVKAFTSIRFLSSSGVARRIREVYTWH
jgi:hypothetical protein